MMIGSLRHGVLVFAVLIGGCGGTLEGEAPDASADATHDAPGDASVLVCTPVSSADDCPAGCTALFAVGQPNPATCYDVTGHAPANGAANVGCYVADGAITLPSVTCFRSKVTGTLYVHPWTIGRLVYATDIEPCTGVPVCLPDVWP